MQKKKLAGLILAGLLSLNSMNLVQAAFGEGTQNHMQILWENAEYNPHLNDPVVAQDSTIVRVTGGKIRGLCKMASTSISVSLMRKPENVL